MTSKKIVFGVTSIACAAGAYVASKDEGTRRSLTFWSNIFPIFLHYKGIQILNRDLKLLSNETADRMYNECHNKYTDKVKDITFRMRGFYLKQAQLMSIQDDFVPEAYMKWVKLTQDNVPSEFKGSEAKEYVRMQCREELGLDFDEVFESWDDEPLGVASIGEVHRAVLKGSGKVVAVKILVPGIEEKFRSDIHTIKAFCQLAMPQHVSAFDEIEKQFLTEFDYRKEASCLNTARSLTQARWGEAVVVPQAYTELCSKHLLVMEFLDGVRMVDGIKAQFSKLAALTGKTLAEMEEEMKAMIKAGTFVFKSIEEEKVQRQKILSALWWKDVLEKNGVRFLYNISPARLWYGPATYEWTELPIDLGQTLELLSRIQSSSIFHDGIFNGDAHPGNIMLLKDGKIGLIDYGQVKTMSVEARIKYAKLILAHSRMDKEEVTRLTFDELGTKTKHSKRDIAYLHSAFWNDRTTKDVMGEHSIATFIDWLEAQDPMESLPEEYLFAARSSLMLRGMGKAFGLELVVSQLWKSDAEAFLKAQGVEY